MTVTDDDTGVGTAQTTLVVDSVNPTAVIDSTGAFYPQNQRTFIVRQGVPRTFAARTTDVGSDDLVATWTWRDELDHADAVFGIDGSRSSSQPAGRPSRSRRRAQPHLDQPLSVLGRAVRLGGR